MLYALLALLALLQIWLLFRNRRLSAGRWWVRAGLNALLWLVLLAFVWRPTWTRQANTTHVLLVDDEVPGAMVRRVQDSLNLRETVSTSAFRPEEVDSVTLLGQDFSTKLLARLNTHHLRWVPFEATEKPTHLHWKGMVRLGEEQLIRGTISVPKKQKLAVRFGGQTLDSLWLRPGKQSFTLRFPVLAKGRVSTSLWLDEKLTDTIRFFGQGVRLMNVRFLLTTPDFETKTLADWLGRQGHRVELSSSLSEGIEANVQINTPGKATPDLIVTEPGLTGQSLVRKALAEGKSVLVLGLTNPIAEANALNRNLGTRWQFVRVSTEATIPARDGLTALPYRFVPGLNQFLLRDYPIGVQAVGGRVAVSLLTETFPLKLSGDSVAYTRIWNNVLTKLQPVQLDNINVDAPILAGRRASVLLNNTSQISATLRLAGDTTTRQTSALNAQSSATRYRFARPGWQPLADSLEVFVEDSLAHPHERMSAWLLAHARYGTGNVSISPKHEERVPDWIWLVLLLTCLTALWVEPKL